MMFNFKTKKTVAAVLFSLLLVFAAALALSACSEKKALDKIEITTPPAKVEYEEGEKFDPAGLVVTAFYTDDSKAEVTDYTLRPDKNTELDSTYDKVTVFYTEDGVTKSADISITVSEPEPPEITVVSVVISKLPKVEYKAGETFSADGMEWTVTYSDATFETVKFTAETTGVTIDVTSPLTVDDKEITVTYNDQVKKIPITVTEETLPAYITGHEILNDPDKTSYFEGETISIEGLKVRFTYSDGNSEEITFTNNMEGVKVTPDKFDENPNGNPYYEYPDYVTVIYDQYVFTVPMEIRYPAVTEVRLVRGPFKTTYVVGEPFEPSGVQLEAMWEDDFIGSIAVFSYSSVIDYEEGYATVYALDLYYQIRIPVRVPVEVIVITDVTVNRLPDKTEYVAGESFDPTGMIINVTYGDGDEEQIELLNNTKGLRLPDGPLTASDETVFLYYYGNEISVDIEIVKGVFIEAEDAYISGSTYKIGTDAVDVNGVPNASGGKYVSDLNAGGSVTFSFYSDKDGAGDLAFILASKYLKQDYNWTPIEMGDCQFNLICEFSVNGVKYEIPDEVILPGGIDEYGNGMWLWFNWKEVVFENVDFVEGENEVVLTFLHHDINDCSQPSFNGTFTANIDSLKVTSDECEVSVY